MCVTSRLIPCEKKSSTAVDVILKGCCRVGERESGEVDGTEGRTYFFATINYQSIYVTLYLLLIKFQLKCISRRKMRKTI